MVSETRAGAPEYSMFVDELPRTFPLSHTCAPVSFRVTWICHAAILAPREEWSGAHEKRGANSSTVTGLSKYSVRSRVVLRTPPGTNGGCGDGGDGGGEGGGDGGGGSGLGCGGVGGPGVAHPVHGLELTRPYW